MAPKRKTTKAATAADEAEHHNEEEATPTVETPEVAEAAPVEPSAAAASQEPAAAVEAAEEPVPYTPVPVSGSMTEIYSQLQSILAEDSSRVNYYIPQLLELVAASESVDTPILMRVRFVEFVGHHVAQVRDNAALRKIVTALVKIVGGEDNTPQLLTSAVQAFAGLGPVSVVDKNWEYLAREGADVLMQVMIDRDAFPESVRQAAAKSLDSLTHSAFRSVLAKLLHWLSLDREEDEEEQLQKERHMALGRLTRLTVLPSQRKYWTEETQQYTVPLLQRVMGTVDVREFTQLARVCANLPINKDKGNLPLLEWYVSTHKLNDPRHVEAVAIISRHVSGTAEYDLTPALEAAGLLSHNLAMADDQSVHVARVLLLACRIATPEAADKLYPYVFSQVAAVMADAQQALTSANVVAVEALLFAAVAVARKKSAETLQQLNDEAFNASAGAAAKAAAEVYNQAVFAVKKLAANKEATSVQADAVASLLNIKTILEAFALKRLPLGEIRESWVAGHNPMPTAKRARDAPRGGALPPPPHTHAAEVAAQKRSRSQHHQPDQKRARNDNHQNNSNRGNNGNNSNNNRNNQNNNRSHSRNDRRPRRDSRH